MFVLLSSLSISIERTNSGVANAIVVIYLTGVFMFVQMRIKGISGDDSSTPEFYASLETDIGHTREIVRP